MVDIRGSGIDYKSSSSRDPRSGCQMYIDAVATQDGKMIVPFLEVLMKVKSVEYLNNNNFRSSSIEHNGGHVIEMNHDLQTDMLVRAVFHQYTCRGVERSLTKERSFRIYDPVLLLNFHSRDSELTLLGDLEVPTLICTELIELDVVCGVNR